MGKRPQNNDDMELQALKSEMQLMNKRMEEVMNILTGNPVYGLAGIKKDVHDLKSDVGNIKHDIEEIKRQDDEKKKREGFLSIKLDTIPQKIVAFVAFVAVIISIAQGLKSLFNQMPQ
jgi:hypothetical protein